MSELETRFQEAEARARLAEAEVVTLKDDVAAVRKEVQAMMRMVVSLEVERDELRRQLGAKRPSTRPPPPPAPDEVSRNAQADLAMKRIDDLRDLLAAASRQLSELHAEELAFNAKRARILGDTCALLARAVGESGGTVPPPIPSIGLEEKLAVRPVVDISEVAELIDSLRPPPPSR
jgi:regulator of replication initiation timing